MQLLRSLVVFLVFMISISWGVALPPIQFWKTSNGVPVYFIQRHHAPMLNIRVLFRAGSAYDGSYHGLSSLTDSLIGLGTSTLAPTAASESLDNVGAELSNDISRDGAWVGMKLLTDTPYLEPSIHLFEALLTDPRWTDNTLKLAKSQLLTQIHQNNQNPTVVSLNRMTHLLYGDHPYGHPVEGTVNSVSALTIDQVKQFYLKNYVAKNARVVMVGDLSTAKAKQIADEVTSKLPSGKAEKTLPRVELPTPLPQVAHWPFQSVQTVVMLGQIGIDINSTDRYALSMATAILGQLPLTSILFQVIREQAGLAYSPAAYVTPTAERGPFIVLFNTRTAETARAVTLLKKTMADYIKNGPTQAQVKLAREYMLGKFKTQFISNEDLVELLNTIALYNRPLNSWQKAMHAYQTMTREQIKHAIQAHLSMQKMILLTVGQEAQHASK